MAQLKDSLITGDLRVTGTIYGKATNAVLADEAIAVRDKGNGTLTYLNYGAAGMSTTSWIGSWDGYTLKAISPANLKTTMALNNVENTKLSTWTGSSNITTIGTLSSGTVPWARLSNVPTASTSAAGIIQIGTGSGNAAAGNHTHTASLATDTGTSSIILASAGKYKLTAGGSSVIFTMPTSNNYSHPTGAGNTHIPSGGSNGQYLKYGGSSGTATWASFTKPSVTWTDGTSNGPTLKITTDGGASDAVAVPNATSSVSGIVTTGSQTFAGDKTFGGTDAFTVKATSIRFQNKAGNTSQALSGSSNGTKYPYVTSLMIGDGREVTLDEYGDGYLGIHSKYGIFIQSNSNDIKEYDATKTYTVGTLVWYDRKYYRCTTAISTAEAWTAGHWTAVPSGSGTIVVDGTVQPLVTESKDLGTSTYKWNNLYAKKINGTDIASITAQTTQAVYPIKINAIGQITGYGSAQTILALGTTATTAAKGNHTHTTSIATDTGTTDVVALTSGGTFKLTSGGTSVLFKMPTSTNNAGTITGVTGSDGLTGSGTSGSVTIKHAAPSTSPAKTTSAVYPITIDKYGHITAAGTAVTIPAAVSVKGNAETSYRTGQVNLTPANLGISATTSSVTVGSTTFSKYSHPTGDGNKHVPATGTTNNNKFLKAGSTAGSLSWTTIASVSNEILTIVS